MGKKKTVTVPTPSGAYRRVTTSELELFRFLATSENYTVTEEGISLPDGRFLAFVEETPRSGSQRKRQAASKAPVSPEALIYIIAGLYRLREKAEQAGATMLAFIIDQATAEARDRLSKAEPSVKQHH